MGSARLLLALVALSAVFAVWPTRAAADPMDLTLSRLYQPPVADATGNPMTIPCTERIDDTIPKCEPDQEAFAFLASQLGAALAPRLYAPARTLGYNGFYVGLEWSMTPLNINYTTRGDLNNRASVWQLATQGRPSDATGVNQSPANQLLLWTVHARKGFPFGFELGTQIGFLQDSNFSLTRIASYGADIRWAPFEGYHRGIGFLPDLAVRGSINRMTGSAEMDLTIVGADVSLSKQIGVAGQFSLTPYAGYQHLWIIGDSEVVDPSPGRDAWNECGPSRAQYAYCILDEGIAACGARDTACDMTRAAEWTAASPPDGTCATVGDPTDRDCLCGSRGGTWTADLSCIGTPPNAPDTSDINNNMVFSRVWIQRERVFFGLRFLWEHLSITGEFSIDLVEAAMCTSAQPCDQRLIGTSQWTAGVGVGLDY